MGELQNISNNMKTTKTKTTSILIATILLTGIIAPTSFNNAFALVVGGEVDRTTFIAETGVTSATGPMPNIGNVGTSSIVIGSVTLKSISPSGDLWVGTFDGTDDDIPDADDSIISPYNPDWTSLISGNSTAISGSENLNATFSTPVYSAGFEFVEPSCTTNIISCTGDQLGDIGANAPVFDSEFQVDLSLGLTPVGSFTFNATDDVLSFIGVKSTDPFDTMIITENEDSSDNEYFGEFFTSDVSASAIDAVKSWTHTDYNWDPVCDGIVNATGLCVDEIDQSIEIGFRPANVNATEYPTDDVLADPLPQDSNGNYTAFAQIHKNGKFSNTNPGAFYALTTIDIKSDLDTIEVDEIYENCTGGLDENGILKFVSNKETRNVKVAVANSTGFVTEITDDLYDDIGGFIQANLTLAKVNVTNSEHLQDGNTLFVLVKFQDNLKGTDSDEGDFDMMCNNEEVVTTVDSFDTVIAEAELRITNLE
jgi:hypothetical protein